MIWTDHVESLRERMVASWFLVGTPEGKRALGRPRHIWENNVRIDL
jgi:hypothetical protein